MADPLKISELNENTSGADADLLPHVNDPSGTPETMKMTFSNFWNYIKSKADSVYEALGGGGGGASWKNAVLVATTANINVDNPPASIDGISLTADDIVLVKNQTTTSENGIYVWNGLSTPMTRHSSASTFALLEGAVVRIKKGTANANTVWAQTAVDGTIDSSSVTWVEQAASKTELDDAVADAVAAQYMTIKTVQTANYSLAAGDENTLIPFDATSGNLTLTIPLEATHDFSAGAFIEVTKDDSGGNTVTITGASGVSLYSAGGELIISEQFAGASLLYRGSEIWQVVGRLTS